MFVKISKNAERFWIKVKKADWENEDKKITGTIANDVDAVNGKFGDKITIYKKKVVDYTYRMGEGVIAKQERLAFEASQKPTKKK